jgi:two-component system OmpR family response regulator
MLPFAEASLQHEFFQRICKLPMTGRILAADDDAILRDFVAAGLREQGYLVQEAASIAETLNHARAAPFDVWVLDRHMADGDCVAALRTLRAEGRTTPALFLTASRLVEQRVEGLEAGADDYLTKPFSIVELTARVRALLRRPPVLRDAILRRGVIELHVDARRAFVGANEIALSANEWRLLALLAQRPGVVFTRAQIMADVGIAEDAGEVAVDHLVSRMRLKLREHGAGDVIKTMRGLGFAWNGAEQGE